MRRLFRWTAGLLSIAALAKLLGRHRRTTSAPPEPVPEPDPAEELRRKLAAVRSGAPSATADETAPAEVAEAPDAAPTEDAPPAPAGEPALSIEERRAAIHARAQEAIDAMKETDA